MYFALLALSVFSSTNGLLRLPIRRLSTKLPSKSANGNIFPVITTDSFIATIQIGEKEQEFNLLLDSGSSTVVLPSSECSTCGNHPKHTCPGPVEGYTVETYGTGNASDHICSDSLTIAGHKIRNQKLFLSFSEDKFFKESKFDGILGLGYSILADYNTETDGTKFAKTVLENLADQHGIRKVFSTYLSPHPNDKENFILFGGSDKNYYEGNLHYVPVSKTPFSFFYLYAYWQVQASSFKFGEDTLAESITVVIDTGSSALFFPVNIYYEIYNKIQSSGGDLIDCSEPDQLPPFKMQAGNVSLQLEAKYFLSDNSCEFNIGTTNGTSIIMGVPFFQKYYVEFDMEENRIGFAEKKNIF